MLPFKKWNVRVGFCGFAFFGKTKPSLKPCSFERLEVAGTPAPLFFLFPAKGDGPRWAPCPLHPSLLLPSSPSPFLKSTSAISFSGERRPMIQGNLVHPSKQLGCSCACGRLQRARGLPCLNETFLGLFPNTLHPEVLSALF